MLLCGLLSEHYLPFTLTDHLAKVCKTAFPDSKISKIRVSTKVTLGRTKSKAIVKNVIGKVSNEGLANGSRTKLFSVIIDESTVVGRIKTTCISVKYFGSITNAFETKFFKVIPYV